jgi:hypothetical protein
MECEKLPGTRVGAWRSGFLLGVLLLLGCTTTYTQHDLEKARSEGDVEAVCGANDVRPGCQVDLSVCPGPGVCDPL